MRSPITISHDWQPLSLGLPHGVTDSLQSVQASSLFSFIYLKYLFGVVSDEDSNFHLTYNYDDIKKH